MQAEAKPRLETALRTLRIFGFTLAVSILLYAFTPHLLLGRMPKRRVPMQAPFWFAAVADLLILFPLRRRMVQDNREVLGEKPDDAQALRRFLNGNIVTFCLCELIALDGFVLQALGGTLRQAAPFYAVGFLLTLYFIPRSA